MEDSVKLNEEEIKEAIAMYLKSKGRVVESKPKHRPGDTRTDCIPVIHLYQERISTSDSQIVATCALHDVQEIQVEL